MKNLKKKGFTIVELVIVIAVIAILAAVLIPTFVNLTRKANISADTVLAKNLNTALAVYDAENDILTVNTASGNFTVGLVFTHDTSKDILRTRAAFTNSIAKQMCVLTDKYVTVNGDNAYYGVRNNKGVITATNLGRLQINDVALNGMDASQVKTYLKGVKAYYVLNTPEEYSIATKVTPNYIAGDYGVEEFIGGNVPFNSNILFYMRSLVNETRNFLDRLMDGLGSDITAVADKIVVAVKQHYDTEDAGVVDEDGLVEY